MRLNIGKCSQHHSVVAKERFYSTDRLRVIEVEFECRATALETLPAFLTMRGTGKKGSNSAVQQQGHSQDRHRRAESKKSCAG